MWLCILSVFAWDDRYIYSLEVRTNAACEFGKEISVEIVWYQIRRQIRQDLGRIAGRIVWGFWKKFGFASALYPARNPAGLWRVTVGQQVWPTVSFPFYTLLAKKYLHFASCLTELLREKERKALNFLRFNLCQNLEFHRLILNPFRTSDLLEGVKLLVELFLEGKP